MKHRAVLLAVATSVALGSLAGAAERTIQQWTDENGVVHFGDAPPPDAARRDRTVLNDQGVPVRQIPRQMTPDEAAEARRQQEAEARRKAQDSFLLTTYTKVSDIERVRDDRIALIDSQIELARGSLASSEQRLESLSKRMNGFRPYATSTNARRVPDTLAAEVIQALGERRAMLETLARHEQRREQTRAEFEADITRYRELTNRPSIR